ncbi:unnamed protein product [Paramecium pentaurelia]|uniref:Uncharacterized protein n=1 Tax=Paramecium pentaurelia TaxID=43138 RepID=A0A8S1TCD3_9CILI|nr:unnamed protein product [Paramecium pentaurelia]
MCICLTKTSICNIYFYIVIVLTIIDVLITMSIIIYYGRKLKRVLVHVRNRFSSNKNDMSQQLIHPFFEADLPKEKIHQIQLVVISITFNTILYVIIIIILFWSDRDLLCDFEKDDILDVKNNIMIFIFTATQLIPCFIVPYAFNYRLKETTYNDDGLEFTRERAASSKFQIDETNDVFVQRLTRGRVKQEDE